MYRRRANKEVDTRNRWVLSYADFMTLLFAFFVVMYAISSVNLSKYSTLSNALDEAFNLKDEKIESIPMTEIVQKIESITTEVAQAEDKEVTHEPIAPQDDALQLMYDSMNQELSALMKDDLISVRKTDDFIELEMKSSMLFDSGSAYTNFNAINLINKLGGIVKHYQNPIRVEGFTDNVPIDNELFPSNWELSAARAANVVRTLVLSGVQAERLSAIGYGEQFPIADNDTPEGRQENRRVILVISKPDPRRRIPNAFAKQAPVAPEIPDPVQELVDTVTQQDDRAKRALSPQRLPSGGIRFSIKNSESGAEEAE